MTGPRRFDPDELGPNRNAEADDALLAAGWLDAAADVPAITSSAGFANRVMGALADEPTPAPAGFLAPLRRRGLLGGFAASVHQAWLSIGGNGRPMLVRAPALAYVLVVVIAGTSLAGVATVGVAGALGVFQSRPTDSAPPQTPGPTIAPRQTDLLGESDEPSGESEPPSPGESDDATGAPNATDDHGGNPGPGSSGSGSDDNPIPGSSGSGSDDNPIPTSTASGSDDHSGPGSSGSGAGSTSTPKPSNTPRPTDTPRPTETAH